MKRDLLHGAVVAILAPCLAAGLAVCAGCDNGTSMGPSGGTITASGSTLIIPPGALDATQQIKIQAASTDSFPADVNLVGSPIQITPEGLVFKKAVTLTMPYSVPAGVLETNVTVATLEGGVWVPIPGSTVDLTAKTVSVSILHLSLFAPFFYDPTPKPLRNTYVTALFGQGPNLALARMNNTIFNNDGTTGSFGPESADPTTYTPFAYAVRSDGLALGIYTAADGAVVQTFTFVSPGAKVLVYADTSLTDVFSSFSPGFPKPAPDYQPLIGGNEYFIATSQASKTDTNPSVAGTRWRFNTDLTGVETIQSTTGTGTSLPFIYVVQPGGQVDMTITSPDGSKRVQSLRLNPDAGMVVQAFEDAGLPAASGVNFGVGTRLSTGKTNANLSGVYHGVLYNADVPSTHVLYQRMTFDGQGGGTYSTWDEQFELVIASGALTYTVAADGTLDLKLMTGAAVSESTGALSADGDVFIASAGPGGNQTISLGVRKLGQ